MVTARFTSRGTIAAEFTIDIDRARRLIDHWPETTPDDQQLAGQLRFFLPSVLYVTRYLDFMTGRNQR